MDPNLPEYGPQPQQPQNPFAASEPGSPAATNVQMMEMLAARSNGSSEPGTGENFGASDPGAA